jgi:hypothetical protein
MPHHGRPSSRSTTNDDGELVSLRFENWKFVFCE